ncbi:hypothetical protein NW762_013851 [Fusarium torreyae]|uniref:BTB domain-containing protein n=1 Tax=Fusarium torreyae TaxID=1237075 RepID=A0A9W8RL06_9HYPO|nr:hypothetical protein NW762_013851 [Fusarium torreyae]
MKTSLLVLAPRGDTELVLRRPNPNNANKSNGNQSNHEDRTTGSDHQDKCEDKNETDIAASEKFQDHTASVPKLGSEPNKEEHTIDPTPEESDGDTGTEATKIETTTLLEFHDSSASVHKVEDLRNMPPSTNDAKPIEVRFRVSSAHLTLASPVFKAMLDGPFSEGIRNQQGLYEIKTFDWGAEALLILLDIIHGHHRSTPKTIELTVLLDIAVLVDYYQCHEIVEPFAEMWIAALGDKTWEDYDSSCMPWMFVSWVFGQEKFFNHMVATCLKYCKTPIRTNLPLPSTILEKLEYRRQSLITSSLDNFMNCSCMLLGSLMKQMRQHGLEIPRPKAECYKNNVMDFRKFMGNLDTPVWHEKDASWRFNQHACSFKQKTQPWRDEMARTYMDDVRYQDFISPKEPKTENIPSREVVSTKDQ